jgi:hypothetical protein
MLRAMHLPVLAGFGLLTANVALADNDLLVAIRERHRNSRDLIRTIVASYEIVGHFYSGEKAIPHSRVSAQWSQDGDLVRCKAEITSLDKEALIDGKPGILENEFAVKNGELTSVSRSTNSKRVTATFRPFPPKGELPHDLWAYSLFTLDQRTNASLADLLDKRQFKSIEDIQRNGGRFYKIVIHNSNSLEREEFEIEIDVKRNHLVRRFATWQSSEKGASRSETKVLSFRESVPGIQFPVRVERKVYLIDLKDKKERLLGLTETHFRSVVINQPIDPKRFELSLAPGTAVVDYRDNTSYLIGPDGQPKDKVDAVPKPILNVAQPTYQQQPSRISPYLWGLLGALSCMLLLWYFRQRRMRKA